MKLTASTKIKVTIEYIVSLKQILSTSYFPNHFPNHLTNICNVLSHLNVSQTLGPFKDIIAAATAATVAAATAAAAAAATIKGIVKHKITTKDTSRVGVPNKPTQIDARHRATLPLPAESGSYRQILLHPCFQNCLL